VCALGCFPSQREAGGSRRELSVAFGLSAHTSPHYLFSLQSLRLYLLSTLICYRFSRFVSGFLWVSFTVNCFFGAFCSRLSALARFFFPGRCAVFFGSHRERPHEIYRFEKGELATQSSIGMSMGETNESPEVRDDLTGFQTISRGEEIEAKTRDAAKGTKRSKTHY
jgi:hypothetical protein